MYSFCLRDCPARLVIADRKNPADNAFTTFGGVELEDVTVVDSVARQWMSVANWNPNATRLDWGAISARGVLVVNPHGCWEQENGINKTLPLGTRCQQGGQKRLKLDDSGARAKGSTYMLLLLMLMSGEHYTANAYPKSLFVQLESLEYSDAEPIAKAHAAPPAPNVTCCASPTPGAGNQTKAGCEAGGAARHDGGTYHCNTGKGTPTAVCGQNASCNCCRIGPKPTRKGGRPVCDPPPPPPGSDMNTVVFKHGGSPSLTYSKCTSNQATRQLFVMHIYQ